MRAWLFRRPADERTLAPATETPPAAARRWFGIAGTVVSLLRDRSGAAAVEFAIVALPLLGFVLLIFQVSIYHFSLQSLDYATRLAAREVMVGAAQASATSEGSFKAALLCPNILLAFSCDKVTVNAYKVEATSDEAANTGIYRFIDTATKTLRSAPAGSSFCLGGPGDYVLLDVTYTFPNLLGSLLSGGAEGPAGFLLRSTTFFRNEPFAGAGASC